MIQYVYKKIYTTNMFDSTFFKFLIAFIVIIGLSFVVMGVTGGSNGNNSADSSAQKTSSN